MKNPFNLPENPKDGDWSKVEGVDFMFDEGDQYYGDGPSWSIGNANSDVKTANICGRCYATKFRVGHPRAYNTTVYCDCGNFFTVHDG